LRTQEILRAMQSKAWVCSRSLAGTAGLNRASGRDICLFECYVLSIRGLHNESIRHSEESY